MKTETMEQLTFDAQGLIPAVVQDFQSGEVLMLAYMNRESLSLTLEKGETYFWSRSRQELWHKGETSGNVQKVRAIRYDCDSDALLVKVDQSGSACHTGEYACFLAGREGWPDDVDSLGEVLGRLSRIIHRRNIERPADSYTVKLLEGGVDRILRKVGEEATEVVIAGKNQNGEEIAWEVADLLYHLMVLLELRGVSLHHVARELARRMGERDSKDDAAR